MHSMTLVMPGLTEQLPVFVYGTLRVGQPNHRLAAAAVEHAQRATLDGYELVDGGAFPWIVPGPGVVVGDLLSVDRRCWSATLARLDALEGFAGADDDANLYDRRSVTVATAEDAAVTAWAYVAGPGLSERRRPTIAGGDWPRR